MKHKKKPVTETALAEARIQLMDQIYEFTDDFGCGVEPSLVDAAPEWMLAKDDSGDCLMGEILETFFTTIAHAIKAAAEQALETSFDAASKVLLAEIAKLTGDVK